jgi:hypothetical protein
MPGVRRRLPRRRRARQHPPRVPTHEAKEAAADAYFKEVVDPLLAREHEKSMEELACAEVAKTFRFICPSYYRPRQAGRGGV